ncbi:MAG: lysylphosphatidylglycerol synthase transmembrane domain-containing protein, partial [bacterium]
MNRKRWLQLIVGCALSALFLWIALKDVEFGRLGQVLLKVNWLWIFANFAAFYIGMYWRAFRWARLFQPTYQIPARRAWPPLMICFAMNSVLPGRAGEFARAYIIGKQEKVSFATSFATVVVERLLDGMILLLLLAAAMGIMPPLNTSLQLPYGPNLLSGPMAFALCLAFAALWLAGSVWFLLRLKREAAVAQSGPEKNGFWGWASRG